MQKSLVFLVVGLVLGGAIGSYVTNALREPTIVERLAEPPVRDIVNVVEMTVTEAEAHREDRYASIRTIEDTLALPTDFAETEALYVIAGRADSNELQDLIYQASRIAERTDRNAALGILLMRLTELDPLSAIAIARSPALAVDDTHEASVWRIWGRLDLDAALAAAQEGTAAQKNVAAQALYLSLRGVDDSKAAVIEAALGIAPSRSVQGQRLYALADQSPANAILYIESLRSRAEQQEKFQWLAYYLNQTGRANGDDFVDLIQSPANRRAFENTLASYRVQTDPESALQALMSEDMNAQKQNSVVAALQQLAQQDAQKAIEYLERFPELRNRNNVKQAIASAMAQTDPFGALAWARDNDTSADQSILIGVIGQVAQQDPQLALSEAQNLRSAQGRQMALSTILSITASADPEEAAQVLALIEDPNARRSGLRDLATTWARYDVDAAVGWVSTLAVEEQDAVLDAIGQNLVHSDLDAAIALLPRVSSEAASSLRRQIVMNIANQRSVDEAQAFIAQFKGSPDYPRLQMTVISTIASQDPARAMRMVGSIADGQEKDQVVAGIVGQQARHDPRQAVQWLGTIRDPGTRVQAVSQLAYNWFATDPESATAWVDGMPAGEERDMVIMSTMSMRSESPQEMMNILATISNADSRKQAEIGYVSSLMRTDRAAADRLFETLDLTDAERQHYRTVLEQGSQFVYD